jgi:hypothetical protein
LDIILLNNANLNYRLASMACFILSCKFLHSNPKLPSYNDLAVILNSGYSTEEIKKAEIVCIKLLKYRLDICTPYSILTLMLNNGIIFDDEISSDEDIMKNEFLENFCEEKLKYFISDPRFLDFCNNPLYIACSLISLSREELSLKKPWSERMEKVYNVNFSQFAICYTVLKNLTSINCQIKKLSPHSNYTHYIQEKSNLRTNIFSSPMLYESGNFPNPYQIIENQPKSYSSQVLPKSKFSSIYRTSQDIKHIQLTPNIFNNGIIRAGSLDNVNIFTQDINHHHLNESCETSDTYSARAIYCEPRRTNFSEKEFCKFQTSTNSSKILTKTNIDNIYPITLGSKLNYQPSLEIFKNCPN